MLGSNEIITNSGDFKLIYQCAQHDAILLIDKNTNDKSPNFWKCMKRLRDSVFRFSNENTNEVENKKAPVIKIVKDADELFEKNK